VTGVQWGHEVIDRVAQLTQKTNQCNLTTKRYTSSQIAELHASSHSQVLAYRVSDRFGDSGIVGVSILRFDGDDCEIDSLLLSCRVIGRGIETAMLFDIVQQASFQACRRLIGYYRPTPKNMSCADFYETHGFRNVSGAWILNLAEKVPFHLPSWIMLQPGQSRSKNLS
jgi:FkbH-like protein